IRKKNAQRLGLARYQAARAAVRDVAHLAGDLTDETSGFFFDRSAAVDHPRNGSNGHLCSTRDILDRDHAPRDCGRARSAEWRARAAAGILADLYSEPKYVIVYTRRARGSPRTLIRS